MLFVMLFVLCVTWSLWSVQFHHHNNNVKTLLSGAMLVVRQKKFWKKSYSRERIKEGVKALLMNQTYVGPKFIITRTCVVFLRHNPMETLRNSTPPPATTFGCLLSMMFWLLLFVVVSVSCFIGSTIFKRSQIHPYIRTLQEMSSRMGSSVLRATARRTSRYVCQ